MIVVWLHECTPKQFLNLTLSLKIVYLGLEKAKKDQGLCQKQKLLLKEAQLYVYTSKQVYEKYHGPMDSPLGPQKVIPTQKLNIF